MDSMILHNELISIGCLISSCDSEGGIQWIGKPNELLSLLVLAAHEQSLTSTEGLALQAAITPTQWQAYCDVRDAPMRQARELKYHEMADALLFKAIETATQVVEGKAVTLVFDKADLDTWKATKEAIRVELPYATDVLKGG